MHIKTFDKSDLDSMDIVTSDFVKLPYENAVRKICFRASVGEAFTFCRNDHQFYASCGIFQDNPTDMVLWMIVDKHMTDSPESKSEFLKLCGGLEKYIRSKYKGFPVRCKVIDTEERYHRFVRCFRLSFFDGIYKGVI